MAPGLTVLLDPATGVRGVKPVFAPDGSRIVFVCADAAATDDDICLMDPDGTDVAPLVDDPAVQENHPSWGVTPPKR